MFYFLCASHSTADPLKLPSAASSPLSPTVFFPARVGTWPGKTSDKICSLDFLVYVI